MFASNKVLDDWGAFGTKVLQAGSGDFTGVFCLDLFEKGIIIMETCSDVLYIKITGLGKDLEYLVLPEATKECLENFSNIILLKLDGIVGRTRINDVPRELPSYVVFDGKFILGLGKICVLDKTLFPYIYQG